MIIRRLLRLSAVVLALLLIPFVGMHLSSEINWSNADFVIAAIVLYGSGIAYEVIRTVRITPRQRLFTGIALALVLCMCWVELAVGVFGTPFAGS